MTSRKNWFTAWIALRVERYPYGLLTMIVSLEAIFLSTDPSAADRDPARQHPTVASR